MGALRPLCAAAVMGMAAVFVAIGSPASAGTSHPGGPADTCDEVLAGRPTGGLNKRTEPADGSLVTPGQEITVTLTWNAHHFSGDRVHKVIDCVTVDDHMTNGLSRQHRDAANNGTFEFSYSVPNDVPVGARLCDRALVSGPTADGFGREKSNDVCFDVGARPDTAGPDARP